MCGIAGIVHRDAERPVSPDVVTAMCDAIRHRGPDDQGFFIHGRVGLGMRRLSIIDLAGSQQPIANEDGSANIVFNGEIYNYRARGHGLRTDGDTETILHLYEELGPACVQQLRGMFAFAIWDERAKRLVLARDRFGMKPLYFATGSWGLAFASELKALHAVGLAGGELDWDALEMFFHLGYIPAPATPFRNVRKLEPGHTLVWEPDGSIVTECQWDLPTTGTTAPPDLEQHVLDWLDGSVAAHLESDVPVAAFLSGGLDSSAVVSSMALVSGDVPHAYTARYHGSGAESADETPLASALAQKYGARLTIVDIKPELQNIFEPIVRALDEPHADESAIPSWLISQAVAADYKVALAGTGGDELFAGYRRHIGLLFSDWYGRLPGVGRRAMSALVNRIPEPRGAGLGVHRLKRFVAVDGATVPERYLSLLDKFPRDATSLFSGGIAESVRNNPAGHRFATHYQNGGQPRGLKAALYLDYKTYLPDDLLHLSDRIAMAHSLEVRVPFVDHVFVEGAFPIADRVKIGLAENKRLLKRVLRGRLPPQHFRAPKRGFVGPTAAWLRNELRDVLVDELSPTRMSRLGYFDTATVQRLLDEHLSRRHNREGVLWALVCFSTWHRLFIETGVRAGDRSGTASYA